MNLKRSHLAYYTTFKCLMEEFISIIFPTKLVRTSRGKKGNGSEGERKQSRRGLIEIRGFCTLRPRFSPSTTRRVITSGWGQPTVFPALQDDLRELPTPVHGAEGWSSVVIYGRQSRAIARCPDKILNTPLNNSLVILPESFVSLSLSLNSPETRLCWRTAIRDHR